MLVRPGPKRPAASVCPFCPGNESHTPHEIFAYRKEGFAPNGPGWSVRVIPEADPYFRIEQELVREGLGLYDRISPRGATELIVESPSHDDTAATLGDAQWEQVLWMYGERIRDLKQDSPRSRSSSTTCGGSSASAASTTSTSGAACTAT